MNRSTLFGLTLLVCSGGAWISAPAFADSDSSTSNVSVRSDMSVGEIKDYVETIDRRFQKGRYDGVDKKQNAWIVEQIAALRSELQTADPASAPAPSLVALAGDFETGMIKIEEGGIVCSKERPTGSHRVAQKCRTRKAIEDEREASQDSLRRVKRPQSLPSGG